MVARNLSEGARDEQDQGSEGGILRAMKLLCMVVTMVDICHYTFVETWRMDMPPGVTPDASYGFGVRMCQCRLSGDKRRSQSVGDVGHGWSCTGVRAGGTRELSVLLGTVNSSVDEICLTTATASKLKLRKQL